ncbi:hypothetical protein [Streptomyces sp. NPDC051546]|uniref:hypothetical protein n=1 Tax=Streptomyces sp. NPDC051546 TaxID=3365655 RepID=UPI00378BB0FB
MIAALWRTPERETWIENACAERLRVRVAQPLIHWTCEGTAHAYRARGRTDQLFLSVRPEDVDAYGMNTMGSQYLAALQIPEPQEGHVVVMVQLHPESTVTHADS